MATIISGPTHQSFMEASETYRAYYYRHGANLCLQSAEKIAAQHGTHIAALTQHEGLTTTGQGTYKLRDLMSALGY